MKIKLNGNNQSLRELMEREGFRFPCGGKGICGRCKVIAADLTPTERDKRFLSDAELAKGVRLACDKTLNGAIELEPLFSREENRAERLDYADSYAVFTDYATFIGLAADGEVKDSVALPPTEISHSALRGVAQKETVELIERHSVAKAGTMLLAADPLRFHALTGIGEAIPEGDTVEAALFNMPADDVYLPPIKGDLTGGNVPLEAFGMQTGEMSVAGGLVMYMDENSLHTAYILRTAESVSAFKATVEYFLERFMPVKRNYVAPDNLMAERGGFHPVNSKIPENAAAALSSNRIRAQLRRLSEKIESEDLVRDDMWQKHFAAINNK